jgi:hypothetical protein
VGGNFFSISEDKIIKLFSAIGKREKEKEREKERERKRVKVRVNEIERK